MTGRLRKTFRSIAGRGLLGREAKSRVLPQNSPAQSIPEPTPRPEAPDRIAAAQERLLKEIPPREDEEPPKKKKKKSKGKKKTQLVPPKE